MSTEVRIAKSSLCLPQVIDFKGVSLSLLDFSDLSAILFTNNGGVCTFRPLKSKNLPGCRDDGKVESEYYSTSTK